MLIITNMVKVNLYGQLAALRRFNKIKDRITDKIKIGMETTVRDMSKTYWVEINGEMVEHHPSFPGQPPAVMTGQLINAVSSETEKTPAAAILRFGVLPSNSNESRIGYAFFLETGTANMSPRPWITYGKLVAKRLL